MILNIFDEIFISFNELMLEYQRVKKMKNITKR